MIIMAITLKTKDQSENNIKLEKQLKDFLIFFMDFL